MLSLWRWIGPTLLLASLLGAFMALDRTTLHWYVPESSGSAVRAAASPAALPSSVVPGGPRKFDALEAHALSVQYVTERFHTPGSFDCAASVLNEARTRWTTVCTELGVQGGQVRIVSVDEQSGSVSDLAGH